jgi:hypothetical protein
VSERGSAARGADWWATATLPSGGTGGQAGLSGTVLVSVDSNRIQNISNGFKILQTLTDPKGVFLCPQKLEIKYGWKELEMGNNSSYRNVSRFEFKFELKFKEFCMS